MPLTDAQICTLALNRVGEKQPLGSLKDATNAGRLCRLVYPLARDGALEEFPWPFARRRAALALLADDEDDAEARENTGYAYVYALPSDCLVPRYLETGLLNPAEDQKIPFELEDDADQSTGVLLTNQEDAELVYTWRVTETAKFTPLFADALAWRVAYELCFSLPVKPAVGERAMQMYQMKVAEAAASTQRHAQLAPKPKPLSVRARR